MALKLGLDTAETNPILLRKMAERKRAAHQRRIDAARGKKAGKKKRTEGERRKRREPTSSEALEYVNQYANALPQHSDPQREDGYGDDYDDDDDVEQRSPRVADYAPEYAQAADYSGETAEHVEDHPGAPFLPALSRQDAANYKFVQRREQMKKAEERRRRRALGLDEVDEPMGDPKSPVEYTKAGLRLHASRPRRVHTAPREKVATVTASEHAQPSHAAMKLHQAEARLAEAQRTISVLRQQLHTQKQKATQQSIVAEQAVQRGPLGKQKLKKSDTWGIRLAGAHRSVWEPHCHSAPGSGAAAYPFDCVGRRSVARRRARAG